MNLSLFKSFGGDKCHILQSYVGLVEKVDMVAQGDFSTTKRDMVFGDMLSEREISYSSISY